MSLCGPEPLGLHHRLEGFDCGKPALNDWLLRQARQAQGSGSAKTFLDGMKNLYYDTVLYTEDALRLLINTVGPERCLYGAECPGVGSAINPDTGNTFDDIRPLIEKFDWLTAAQKKMIFEDNARKLFHI